MKRTGADLGLEPDFLEVAPGSSVAATVTVHNLGDEVEHFELEVNGPAGAFATADPPELRMTKGGKGTAVLRFSPARRSDQPAGPQHFQVVARSTVNSDVAPLATGTVVVGPYAQIAAELLPEVTRGRRPGTQRIEVINDGNEPTTVLVDLHDKDDELVFEPRTFEDRLAAGERKQHVFTVCGPRPWFGRTQSYPFTAEVQAQGVPQPVRVDGTRRQVPRLPWWIPTVALALVGLAIALFALLRPEPDVDLVPTVAGIDSASAVASLREAGYQVVEIQKEDPDVPAGTVIDTDPKGGTELPDGESVGVFVSQGECPSGCPVPVPSVSGLAVDRAEELVVGAGLQPERRPELSEQPADTVTRTEPPVATPVALGAPVALFVSSGPTPSASPSGSGTNGPADPGSSTSPGATGPPGPGGSLTVPAVVGVEAAQARAELKELGLLVRTVLVRTDEGSVGEVRRVDPPVDQSVERGSTVTLTVAAPLFVDLVAQAGGANWMAGDDVVAIAVGPGSPGPTVYVSPPEALLEDGSTAVALVTQPAEPDHTTVTGTFAVDILAGDHLTADVGFLAGSSGPVTFAVLADGRLLEETVADADDGTLDRLDVDLTGAEEATSLTLRVTVGPLPTTSPTPAPATTAAPTGSPAPGAYAAVWRNLQIEGPTE